MKIWTPRIGAVKMNFVKLLNKLVYLLIWKPVSALLLISLSFLGWLLLLLLLLLVAVSEHPTSAGKETLSAFTCLQASPSTSSRLCRTLPFHPRVTSTYSPCVVHSGLIPMSGSNWTCLIHELLLEFQKQPKISSNFAIHLLIKPSFH